MKGDFSYNNKFITKDGKPYFPVMGEFHYSRYPADMWEKELLKMKAGGVDIVSSYVIWIHHEEIEDQYDFTGNKDLRRFVKACEKCGMYMFLRIGPWSHAEARNGGFPDWLVNKHKNIRTNDADYLADVKKLYSRIYEEVKGCFIGDGGAIIGVQIENEYGHCGGLGGDEGEKHMRILTEMAKEIGYDAPLYTATGWGGAVTGGLLPVMGGYCDAPWDQSTDKLAPSGNYVITYERNDHGIGSDHHIGYGVTFDFNDFPYLTAELGGGLQVTKHRRTVPSGHDIGAMSLTKLASGCNLLGYYMYHGGTNPHGKLTTLQESTATGYLNDLPEYSYDFKAPLREYGQRAESYGEIKLLSMFVKDFGSELCTMPAFIPESTSSDPNDLTDLRMSVRHNGKKGYIFVNNYQRLYDMAEHKDTVLSAELDGEKITLPPVDIRNGDYFFYPVNMQTGGGTLKYITATPLCMINGKAVLYTDRPYKYEAVGNAEFEVISREDALNAYKLNIYGEEYLIISDGIVCEKDNGFRLYGESSPVIKTYPRLKKVPAGFEYKAEENGLHIYSCTCKKENAPSVTFALISETDGVKKYEIKVSDISPCEECYVKIDYTGTKSRLYIDGQLADDDFYTGEGWTTGLARYGFPEKFEVEIYPLFKDDHIYFEHAPEFEGRMICEITSANAVCEYVFDIEL